MAKGFSSTSTYIICNTPVVTTYPITMACFFNVNNITAGHNILSIADNASDVNYFALIANGASVGDPLEFHCRANATNDALAASTTGFTANTWYHGCGVAASATSRAAFINGGSKGTNANNRTPNAASLDNTVIGGTRRLTAMTMAGMVAEAAIWNIDLTDAEVFSLSRGISPLKIRPQNLVFYAPIIRDTIDYKGKTLVTNGAVTQEIHPRIYLV